MASTSLPSRDLPHVVIGLVGTVAVMVLLYFGRDVLIPITLAFIFSFLIAPFVRLLRRLGLGKTLSVCTGVLMVTLVLGAMGTVLVSEVTRLGATLPQYRQTIMSKLEVLDQLTRGTLGDVGGPASELFDHFTRDGVVAIPGVGQLPAGVAKTPVLVEIHEPPLKPLQLLGKIATSLWPPLETAGIVFIVLIFVLLEHEELRDRFIRLAGSDDLRATTIAVNDAGERLSRFFISQFLVNLATGVAVCIGLSVLGLGQALLWGAMTAVLRYIPYVGVWIAAFCATLLAAAIDPGWSMPLMTLGLFLLVEIVVSQTIEPKLYGHTTGLSPFSVVVAAIFWSWIWGPVGLMLSTPLTLCLVVAGRYVRALNVLEIMFGELPALTMPQNFYQRVLSGDPHEIIAGAKRFMQHHSLASYCDDVLLPALRLAHSDLINKVISPQEEAKVTSTIIAVIEALSGHTRWWKKSRQRKMMSGVGISAGRQLRERRISDSGEWQGSFDVPEGSVVLVVGFDNKYDELATEILVRILREKKLDARSMALADLHQPAPPEATPALISIVCLVSVDPLRETAAIEQGLQALKEGLPNCKHLAVLLSSPFERSNIDDHTCPNADHIAYSYDDVLQCCQQTMEKNRTS